MKEHNEDGRNGVRRRVCWPPETVSAVAGPEAWECGLRWSPSSPPLLSGAACSSSWLWPCYSHRSQSIFAARNNNVHYLQLMSSILKFPFRNVPLYGVFFEKDLTPRAWSRDAGIGPSVWPPQPFLDLQRCPASPTTNVGSWKPFQNTD